ncbi:MAG: FxsA family protein [Deltaproteobacteria bacterium]|nr:MAG: FxsA family protein [Deltaproteobacteria bacterium]
MLGRLILLLTIVPLVELVLLIQLGRMIGFGITLALIVVTGIAGAWLARREWRSSLRRLNEDVAAGKMPADALLDGLAVLIAGALLLTPGILTDIVGFALLTPLGRAPIRRVVKRRVQQTLHSGSPGFTVWQMGGAPGGFPGGAGGFSGFPGGGAVVDVTDASARPRDEAGQGDRVDERDQARRSPTAARPPARVLRDGDVIDVTTDGSGGR